MDQYVQWIQMEKLRLIKESLSTLEQNIENVEEARWKVCLPFRIQSYICPNANIAYRNCWNSFNSPVFIEVSSLGRAQLRSMHSRGKGSYSDLSIHCQNRAFKENRLLYNNASH
jgi:hypothetical protein